MRLEAANETLNPKPYTLNPKTRNPTVFESGWTANDSPETLPYKPQSSTPYLNPKSSTPEPKP
jgi:hypothetical protein